MFAKERLDDRFARLAAPRRFGRPEDVLVVGIYRDGEIIGRAVEELRRSHHRVTVRLGAMGDPVGPLADVTALSHLSRGKFQNVNDLLTGQEGHDWLLVIDDDVELPAGFLDVFIEVCRTYDFALAQPAQTRYSNANWPVTKRRSLSVARTTRFVEIGPVTGVRADAMQRLLPFPEALRYGWGLDFHWAHVMQTHGLRMGVVDVVAVKHVSRQVASTYSWDAAQEEGRAYLRSVPHLPTSVAARPLRVHRRPLSRRRPD